MSVVFVNEEAASAFECAICFEIMQDPVYIGCQSHLFCRDCMIPIISNANHNKFRCPTCRRDCNVNELKSFDWARRQMNQLLVKCPNHKISKKKRNLLNLSQLQMEQINNPRCKERGRTRIRERDRERERNGSRSRSRERYQTEQVLCQWTGPWEKLGAHISKCELHLVGCNYCNHDFLRKHLNKHFLECGKFPMICPQCNVHGIARNRMSFHIDKECPNTIRKCKKCQQRMARCQIRKHLENDCKEMVIVCDYVNIGCNAKTKRKNYEQHLNQSIIYHLKLVKDSQINKNEITKNLLNRVDGLQRRLNDKDDVINMMKHQIDFLMNQHHQRQLQNNHDDDDEEDDNEQDDEEEEEEEEDEEDDSDDNEEEEDDDDDEEDEEEDDSDDSDESDDDATNDDETDDDDDIEINYYEPEQPSLNNVRVQNIRESSSDSDDEDDENDDDDEEEEDEDDDVYHDYNNNNDFF